MRKIPKKYASLVFTFYATMMMAFIMSAVLVALNTGIDSGWFARTLRAYVIAWHIAFFRLLRVSPLSGKLMAWLIALFLAFFACARWSSNWWTGRWSCEPAQSLRPIYVQENRE